MGARDEIRTPVAALWLRPGAPIFWRSGRGLALVLGHPPKRSDWQMWLQRRAPKSTKPATSSLSFWSPAEFHCCILSPSRPPAYILTYIPPASLPPLHHHSPLPPQPNTPPTQLSPQLSSWPFWSLGGDAILCQALLVFWYFFWVNIE